MPFRYTPAPVPVQRYYDPRGYEVDFYPQEPAYTNLNTGVPVYDPPLGFPKSGSRLDFGGQGGTGSGAGAGGSAGGGGGSSDGRFVSDAEKLGDALGMNAKLEEELKMVLSERDEAQEATKVAEAERDAEACAKEEALAGKLAAETHADELQEEIDLLGDELDGLRRRVRRSVDVFLEGDKVPADGAAEATVTESESPADAEPTVGC